LGRPPHKHIDNEELDALVPSRAEGGRRVQGLSPEAIREAATHLASCVYCTQRARQYSALLNLAVAKPQWEPAGEACPDDIDWYEVAAGLWPELKASQLIRHAATCDQCGPLLCAATRLEDDISLSEERLLAQFKGPLRPKPQTRNGSGRMAWLFARWAAPVFALMLIATLWWSTRSSPMTTLSASEFSELAVTTHQQYLKGALTLDLHSNSQHAINDWIKAKSPFPLALPGSEAGVQSGWPYRPEGVRLLRFGNTAAALIAYAQTVELQTADLRVEPVSLVVVPTTVAAASGGVVAKYPKVSFHYSTLHGYRVVTWSQHSLTYALISHESPRTQRSCMVCHSPMRDRELTHTPPPLME
jgi:hypothetical protein